MVIILGSSRKDGNTYQAAQQLSRYTQSSIVDLTDYNFNYYDYEHQNRSDDFFPLFTTLIKHDVWVLATPVYWYSMSGIMKVFFDRLTDILTIEKDLGRKLRGKKMAALSSSNGSNLGDDFWLPFKETASYLGMSYLGNLHTLNDQSNDKIICDFAEQLKTQTLR